MIIVLQEQTSTDTISLDSVTNFTESFNGSVTSHPVERGSKISDHTIVENPKLKLSGVVSDYNFVNPLKSISAIAYEGGLLNSQENLRILPSGDIGVSTYTIVSKLSQEIVKQRLRDIQSQSLFITVFCYSNKGNLLYSYPNCILTSLDFKEDSDSGEAVYPELSIEQVNLVDVRVVQAEKGKIPSIKLAGQATAGTDKGAASKCGTITKDKLVKVSNAVTKQYHTENGFVTVTTTSKYADGTTKVQVAPPVAVPKPVVKKGTKVNNNCDPDGADGALATKQTGLEKLGAFLKRKTFENLKEIELNRKRQQEVELFRNTPKL